MQSITRKLRGRLWIPFLWCGFWNVFFTTTFAVEQIFIHSVLHRCWKWVPMKSTVLSVFSACGDDCCFVAIAALPTDWLLDCKWKTKKNIWLKKVTVWFPYSNEQDIHSAFYLKTRAVKKSYIWASESSLHSNLFQFIFCPPEFSISAACVFQVGFWWISRDKLFGKTCFALAAKLKLWLCNLSI